MTTNTTQPRQVAWLNAVRFFAFFMLLCCHAADPFNAAATYGASTGEPVDPSLPLWGALWGSLVRPCVPLFVMITGALLLPVKEEMGAFYRRRIPRVLYPFLIWSVLYNLFPWFSGLLGYDASVVYRFFPWADTNEQTLAAALPFLTRIPYHFAGIACHMWYIYLLIGLYLYLPIFSAWVAVATRSQKRLVLLFWLLSTFLPYLRQYVTPYAFGTCSWNEFGLFHYFAGFNGYLLLGHYVRRYTDLSFSRATVIALPMIAVGFTITFLGFRYICSLPEATPEEFELFWTYNSINVVLMSAAWFVWIKSFSVAQSLEGLLTSLTYCGFGIYMIHYFFVGPCYQLVNALHIPIPLQIPVSALFILLFAWSIVAFIKRISGKAGRYLLG